jgi:enolase-phosphatase E1
MPIRTILLDIEGTTSPIHYTYDVLFPYARRHLQSFLTRRHTENEVQNAINSLFHEHQSESVACSQTWNQENESDSLQSAIEYCLWLMSVDRKSTALKTIQGLIWQEGFQSGELQSEVFADVPAAFKRWRSQNRTVAIYSSGSVLAQQLFFRYSEWGDLSGYIHCFFDTGVGPKRVAESYRRILCDLQCPPQEVIFVSDIVEELDAANEAGIATALAVRPGAELSISNPSHRVVTDLNTLIAD